MPLSHLSEHCQRIGRYRIAAGIPEVRCRCFRSADIVWDREREIGFVHPMPSVQELAEFYRTEYRAVMNKRTGLECYMASPNYRAQARSQANWVLPHVGSTGEWLDVGAGYGLLLREVRESLPRWNFHALEADPDTHRDLSQVAQVMTDVAGFWDAGRPSLGSFDVVSLSHVLEHLLDPWTALARLGQHLKSSGLLLVEVPNDNHEELTKPLRQSDLPHLWFFSRPGLERIVRETRFEVIRSAEVGTHRLGRYPGLAARTRQYLRRRVRGPLALLDDPTWYAEGSDRSGLRVLARRPAIEHAGKR